MSNKEQFKLQILPDSTLTKNSLNNFNLDNEADLWIVIYVNLCPIMIEILILCP